ncbi:hypothetical protein H310_03154 [Aphanomyces invadans]|uniref:Uncharacterized protein n=1 Tax=Aphanomyces invadans TaxID=157072 RepID=A0A024UKV0_9STRA|nr:hypothetical protein H310_03154 [Aphanomyces invadans]ETW07081.1 hypothetical protein H310_03154 [Aphanomyces invadans]|eukprot:XP_008865156.1 hypothetical protein H310_03154 [Aphanomyces invadans]
MHALYMYFFLGLKKTYIAKIFCKSISTITNWIERFEKSNDFQRLDRGKKTFVLLGRGEEGV